MPLQEISTETSSKSPTVCCLEFDDFYCLSPGLNELLKIKEHYPGFKATLFTIPFPAAFTIQGKVSGEFNMKKYRDWAKIINTFDWLEIAVHGTMHIQNEYNCLSSQAKKRIQASENVLKEAGLKYKKIFRAPYWQISQDAINVLAEEGYALCLNPESPFNFKIPEGMKTYSFNWNLKDSMPKDTKILKGHGHIDSYNNALNDVLPNIFNLPTDIDFKFVSELI